MFTEAQQKDFEEYETLKLLEKTTKARLAELQPAVMELVPSDKEIEGASGVFYIQNRTKWDYTNKVKQSEVNLKQLKKDEEAVGDAKQTLVPTLYYRVNKENDEIPV